MLASSARYKQDIEAMRERSAGVYQLRPVMFRYTEDPENRRQYGLIAEEVAKVYPELVTTGAIGMKG
ncbi:MAG: tail fiber domain-containing protein [Candidatus Binatia bacterium]